MKSVRIFGLFITLVLAVSTLATPVVAKPAAEPAILAASDKIEADLLDALAAEGSADFIVRFVEQADLSPAYSMGWDQRGEFVYDTLRTVAANSQAQAQAMLDGAGLSYQTFIAGNELYVWSGTRLAADALAALPEVDFIRATRTYQVDPIIEQEAPVSPDTLSWGISYTHADQFWTAFGLQGDGIKVANIDTGVQWDHPALDQAFACATPSDPACWGDPSNYCGGSACDNNGHGTHTMGTMVGDDDPALTYQAGMAPNATWIACKGCATNTCYDYDLNACADWILAPGGDPDNRPHVVNNSWGGGGCDSWYLAKVNAWRAAGTFPAFSAGNNYTCGSIGSPGDYQESFASAAIDAAGNVAAFSSGGPSCYGHDPYTKPNIAAPGVSVCSSVPGGGWSCGYSGTSMASPHSAGAVALLWSCNPSLVGQMNATFEALQNTAGVAPPGDCGAPPDGEGNYHYGYGYLDILAAGEVYCGGEVSFGTLDGYVYDAGTGDPIEGASVTAMPGTLGAGPDAITDPTGHYTMSLVVGTWDATASKAGYDPQTVTGIEIITDTTTYQDFTLNYIGAWLPGPSNPPFQYNRFDGVFNPYDELIYFPGGRTGGSTHDTSIWTYDPVNDVWADTTCNMLENAANITPILIDDDGTGRDEAIYVMGGYDVIAAANIDNVQRFYPSQPGCVVEDVTTDPYPDVDPSNARPVGAGGVGLVDGKIYVFGGWDSTSPYFSDKTWEYDPLAAAGSRWTEIATATLSPARAYINSAVQGGLIYAMGGDYQYVADLVPTDVVEVFDPANPGAGWTALASMPVATAEGRGFGFDVDTLGVGQVEGKLYVAGGGDWPDASNLVLEYDIATDSWDQTFPDLLSIRRNHAGVYVPLCTPDPDDGLPGMWVFGGYIGSDEPPFGNPEYFPLPCAVEPVASFEADPSAGCAPLEVQFTDTSIGPPDEWSWDFGDGDTSTLENPMHTYDFAGVYTVTLVVTNALGSDSTTGTITVFEPPVAEFSWSPSGIYTDTLVQFTDESTGNIVDWSWDFDDGGTSNIQNPTHVFAMTGTYTVSLTVEDANMCSDMIQHVLTVREAGEYFMIYLPLTLRNN